MRIIRSGNNSSKVGTVCTHYKLNFLVEIFAGRRERLRGGVLEIPQLVLHSVVELLRILLSLLMELGANCGVL